MSCEEFRQGHPVPSPASEAHRTECAECRSFAQSWELLGAYPALEVPAGFSRAVRRKLSPAVLRFAAPLAAAAAALLLALFLTHPTGVVAPKPAAPAVTEEERELVENLEILQNYELLRTLELTGENGSPLHEEKK
jgi:hypothetical protein